MWLTSLGRAAQGEALLSGAREFFGEIGAVAWASDLEARLASYQAAEVLR